MRDFGPVEPSDIEAYERVLGTCFLGSPELVRRWTERATPPELRRLTVDGIVVGSVFNLPMGLWVGGRSVPNFGIAAVGVLPEHRGRGHAGAMMRQVLREARNRGFAVSMLFGSSLALYRSVGYELAGALYQIRSEPRDLGRQRGEAELRRGTDADRAVIQARLRNDVVRHRTGELDRGPYVWDRVFEDAEFYVVDEAGETTGYVCFRPVRPNGPDHDLEVKDLVASTPASYRRLAAFLGAHATFSRVIERYGDPTDAWLLHWREETYQVRLSAEWMLRILDVPRALAARGYPGQSGALDLAVEDPELPEVSGRFRLRLDDGRASVEPGGAGDLRLDVRALAAVYTGYRSARDLAALGWVDGDQTAVETAHRVFATDGSRTSDVY